MRDAAALQLATHLAGPRPWADKALVPLSLRQIAGGLGRSPGTVARHVATLADLGVVDATKPLTLNLTRLAELTGEATAMGHHPVTRDAACDTSGEAHGPDVNAVVRLAELAVSCPPLASRLLDLAEIVAGARPGARVGDAARDSTSREVGWLVGRTNQPTTETTSSEQAREDPRDRPRDDEPPRDQARDERCAADLGAGGPEQTEIVVAPLLVACRERGLPGSFNAQALTEALSPYTVAQVEAAVTALAEHVRSDPSVRNPFGLLIHSARTSSGVFSPAPPPRPSPPLRFADEPTRRAAAPLGGIRPGPALRAALARANAEAV